MTAEVSITQALTATAGDKAPFRVKVGLFTTRFLTPIRYDLIGYRFAGRDNFRNMARALPLPLGRRQFDAVGFGFDDDLVAFLQAQGAPYVSGAIS